MPNKKINYKKKKITLNGNTTDLQQIQDFKYKEKNDKFYQTDMDVLENEFPDINLEIIEEIYQENARSYFSTKKKIEEIFGNNQTEKIISEINNFSNKSNEDFKNKSNYDTAPNQINNKIYVDTEKNEIDFNSPTENQDFSSDLIKQNSNGKNNFISDCPLENFEKNNLKNNNIEKNDLYTDTYINEQKNINNFNDENVNNLQYLNINNGNSIINHKNKKIKKNFKNNSINELTKQNSSDNPENNININDLIKFRYDDTFISSDEEKKIKNHKNKNKFKNYDEKNNIYKNNFPTNNNKNNKNSTYNQMEDYFEKNPSNNLKPADIVNTYLTAQKKNSNQYVSIFDENILKEKNLDSPAGEIPFDFNIYYLEELLLDHYIKVISEFFPNLSNTEIMENICEFDFDIDGLVLYLLDNNKITNPTELNKLENNDLSSDFNEEIFKNFYFEENNEYEALIEHNLQSTIEKEIQKNAANKSSNNFINKKNTAFLELKSLNDNKDKEEQEEYFLNKPIQCIETKSIRDDLIKLTKNIGFVEEFDLKWVYFQYMDYNKTYNHFCKPFNFNKNKLTKILEDSQNADKLKNKKLSNTNNNNNYYTGKKPQNIINSNSNSSTNSNNSKKFLSTSSNSYSNDTSFTNNLYKIINEKPQNWKIESNQNFNLNEYQEIRRKLIYQAQLAWRTGRHQDAKVIMAKAKRYKEEINILFKTKKLEVFLRNNETNGLLNMINKKENFIDLHGLNYEESKILTNKKINDIKKKKNNGLLSDSQTFVLTIITGVGNHSLGNRPILLPKLAEYFRNHTYKHKIDYSSGVIKIFI